MEVGYLTDKKADIFHSGRELFYSKGFKETNVSEIVKMAGVGVGTFYNCYESKEQLFLEVFLKENEDVKKSILAQPVNLNDDLVMLASKEVTQNISAINSNLILKEWYNRDLFSKLEKYFYEQGGMKSIEELMNNDTAELIKNWKAEGKIRNDLDDDLILALFNSIPYIDIHKTEIGIQHFPQILYYLTEFIMKGLTGCPK